MTLPSEVDRIPVRIEAAFGADLDDPSSWDWTDLTEPTPEAPGGRLLAESLSLSRGRPDEGSQTQPSQVSFELDNRDGALTPYNAMSPWWPHVRRGTPCRVSVQGGPMTLDLPGQEGAYAATPDAPSLDITGDIDIRIELERGIDPGRSSVLALKYVAAGERSWRLILRDDDVLTFQWSTDGETTGFAQLSSTITTGLVPGRRIALRATLDVDDGAGGHAVTFYRAPTIDSPWTMIDRVAGSGTTSIFASTVDLALGTYALSSLFAYPDVLVHAFELRDGIDGTPVAHLVANDYERGESTLVDRAGLPWTLHGDATIDNWRPRLTGQIDQIAPTWPYGDLADPDSPEDHPGEARIGMTVAGILRRLSQGQKPLKSSLHRLITAPINEPLVHAYWPMEDGRDSTSFASPIEGVAPMSFTGPWRLASDDSLTASEPLPSFSEGPVGCVGQVPAHTPTGHYRVDAFINIPTPNAEPARTRVMRVRTSGRAAVWEVIVNDTAVDIQAFDADGAVVVLANLPSDPRFFDTWVLWSLSLEQDGGSVDWTLSIVPIPLGLIFGTSGSHTGQLGRVTSAGNYTGSPPPDGMSFGQVIVSSGTVIGWLAPADTAWVGETAANRVRRICREEGISVAVVGGNISVVAQIRGDPTASAAMGPQRPTTLLELIHECAHADMGVLSEARTTPALVYRTRTDLYNQMPRLVLNAADSEIANPFEPVLDDQRLRNDITATRVDGSSARAVDEASVAAEGIYDESVEINVASDDQLPGQAGWRLHLGTWPGMRYPTVSSELTVAPEVVGPWLDVDSGDRIQVVNLPPQHPSDVVDLLVQGTTERIDPTRWTPELACSPAGPWTVGVLDGDGTPDTSLDRLDTDGTVLWDPATATESLITVEVTDGPGWVTTAAQPDEFPFSVLIGGEEMEVIGINNLGSDLYLMDVTRSVNGVVKAHPDGTPVHVADPFRLTL